MAAYCAVKGLVTLIGPEPLHAAWISNGNRNVVSVRLTLQMHGYVASIPGIENTVAS